MSPLLANIALSALDDQFEQQWQELMPNDWRRATRKRKGLGNWRLIRYADDFVVMVSGGRHNAEALRGQVAAILAPMGLRLAPEKTRVVHIDEGFDFLGFHIRRMQKRGTNKQYVYTMPSNKAIGAIMAKVKAETYRSARFSDLGELLTRLNQVLRGWANYFRYGVSKRTFGTVDQYTWHRIVRWIRGKYKGKHPVRMKEIRRRFCSTGWRLAWQGVEFTGASSIAVTRYRYRGRNIPAPWTPNTVAAPCS